MREIIEMVIKRVGGCVLDVSTVRFLRDVVLDVGLLEGTMRDLTVRVSI